MSTANDEVSDRNVETWKIKKLIKNLEAARGLVNYFSHFLSVTVSSKYLQHIVLEMAQA